MRLAWIHALQNELGIIFQAERGRSDAKYNQVIIEFKAKGLFYGKETSPKFVEAIYDRLAKYIPAHASKEGLSESEYTGIAIDGDHIVFAYIRDGGIIYGHLLPLSLSSVRLVIEACRNSNRRAVTSENLVIDFGHSSLIGRKVMQTLCDVLTYNLQLPYVTKIRMLFEEWQSLYGQVADLSETQINSINGSLGFSCNARIIDQIPISLFVIHTYNSLTMKLLAAEIVSEITGLTSYSGFALMTATLDDAELIHHLNTDIEHGEIYKRAGIHGFVEEVLFSWYIDASEHNESLQIISDALREILIRLSMYRMDNLSLARSNDVLKRFYQDLVPDVLRKSLGEFYTPDWLVDATLDKVESNWLDIRLLDPTCGSASFLLSCIKRIREEASELGWSSINQLEHIVKNVWGFDLNPLAVQTARVNYLIAIADLIKDNLGIDLEIPVLLADAVYSPAPNPNKSHDIVDYHIGSRTANLHITIPSTLAFDRQRLDRVFEIMEHAVALGSPYSNVAKELVASEILSLKESSIWEKPLEATYNRVLDLHKRNWNGIWFRIVRNYFWSATAGEFDIVAGNPPWVRWSKLPELYRERVKPTCEQYAIFSDTPHHGGNELDISGMITYTVADKWLKEGGQLLFVLTQTHFQSPSSQGFRSFQLNEEYYLTPRSVDDLKELKPFPDAANKTSIFSARKSKVSPTYPVPYFIWKSANGASRNIPEDLTKNDVLDRVFIEQQEANPVTNTKSPWAVLPHGKFDLIQHITGASQTIQGRKGITCDLNGIYFVDIINHNVSKRVVQIKTRPQAGKSKLGVAQKFWVEPDLLYPLLKGAGDIGICSYKPKEKLYAIVPNKGIVKSAYETAISEVEKKSPKLYRYLRTYETQLRSRSTFRGRMKNAPFYAVYNVGDYTFAPWKVVWAEQPGNKIFPVAVVGSDDVPLVGSRIIIPDHKIFFVDFYDCDPAYFLCGLLLCETVQMFIKSHHIMIQVGNIFKHMNLPDYDASNATHKKMVSLVSQAHKTDNPADKENLVAQISLLADDILRGY